MTNTKNSHLLWRICNFK